MSVPVCYTAAANYAAAVLEVEEHERRFNQQLFAVQQQQHQQQLLEQNSSFAHNNYNSNIYTIDNINFVDFAEAQQQQQQQQQQWSSMSSSSSASAIAAEVLDLQPSTSAAAAAVAAAAAAATSAAMCEDNNAEMQTEEWMSDGGRYGTPGAAGLEYQKQAHAQQQLDSNNNNNDDQTMEPMDNEKTNNNIENHPNNNTTSSYAKSTRVPTKLEEKWHNMPAEEMYAKLKEYYMLQDKYHAVLLLPNESKREVTAGGRDGSAYVLRCLKMWYELPSDVLFVAMSLVDRFLDRMAVKPKHMACMSVASFYLAIKHLKLKPIPAEDLVNISQCGCTAGDLERMAKVIENKLGVNMNEPPITLITFVRIYYALFHRNAQEIGGPFFEFFKENIKLEELENRTEVLACAVESTLGSPSTIALVLVCLHIDMHIKESYNKGSPELKQVFNFIIHLKDFMSINERLLNCGFSIVTHVLADYNEQRKQPYKQRLVWKLSSRTLRQLRPTNRFSSDLPTIEESNVNAMEDDARSRTESISSEEEEDWPTSPIIPIFEQC